MEAAAPAAPAAEAGATDVPLRRLVGFFAVGLVCGACAAVGVVGGSAPRAFGFEAFGAQRRSLLAAGDACDAASEGGDFGSAGWGALKRVDRLEALQHVNGDIPAAIQTGPKRAWLLGHGPSGDDGVDAGLVPSTCEELDVVVAQSAAERCLVLSAAATTAVPHHVTRWERSNTHATGWATVSRIRESKQRMPGEVTRRRARTLAVRLFSKLDDVRERLAPVLAAAAAHTPAGYAATMGAESRGAVFLMCINWGNLDLLINFLRSACARSIDVRNLVVFAADAKVEAALRAIGVHVFSHPALGQFDANAARSYGDHTFVEMMWLKLTCVYLVNDLGYDLLFQDADLYWWRHPWDYFAARPDVDTFWMDDGARTARFAPHFPNTGYYLIRYNKRTAIFAETLVGMYDVVLAWQSHQAVVSQVLAEMHALHALSAQILEKEAFPSGKQLHHNRPLFKSIADGTYEPFCFHMCWTAGKADKLKFLKQENLWYLEKDCELASLSDIDDAALRTCALGDTCPVLQGM